MLEVVLTRSQHFVKHSMQQMLRECLANVGSVSKRALSHKLRFCTRVVLILIYNSVRISSTSSEFKHDVYDNGKQQKLILILFTFLYSLNQSNRKIGKYHIHSK